MKNDDKIVEKDHAFTIYEQNVKPTIDKILAFMALAILLPVFCAISIAIYFDDQGTIIFMQTRVGKDKHFLPLDRFRSMKMYTSHDVPTASCRG